MAAYVLIELEILDPQGFQEYLKLAAPTVKQYEGKAIVGGAMSQTLEGDWHPHLLSIGEFPSVEQALRWYHSDDYAPARELRLRVTNSKAIVVQGIEDASSRAALTSPPHGAH
jgi:uncharacterized protein (DUF1330 family)